MLADGGAESAQDFDFLPIQFLNQDYDNFEYETVNFAGTIEARANDRVRLFFDAILNDQERRQESSRVQGSGVSSLRNFSDPSRFETVDFGTLVGANGAQDLGTIRAALTGIIGVNLDADDDDPNLRFSTDTNSRLTDSRVYRAGTEVDVTDRLSAFVEFARSTSDTTTPSFNTTLNFINPNAPLDAGGGNDNAVPFIYDLNGGMLTFAVAQDAPFGPSTEQLLDPANVVLRDVNISRNETNNKDEAFRTDFAYDMSDSGLGAYLTSVDAGYRYNATTSERNAVNARVGLRSLADSPRGNLFADLLVAGPDNFDAADGRTLFVRDFLLIDPELVADDPGRVLATLQGAIDEIGGSRQIGEPTSSDSSSFEIEEKTHVLYAQANFDYEMVRGNVGLRYLETEIDSIGNVVADTNGDGEEDTTRVVTSSTYDFLLPRVNVVADLRDDVVLRAGYARDIRRPSFTQVSTSTTFGTSPNSTVNIGNPAVEPEEVDSFDVSADWYFASSAVFSVGYFNKRREGLIVRQEESPFEDPVTGFRDITAPCEGGGIFNPVADINVFGPENGTGVCVPTRTFVNDSGTTTQQGVEVTFQYDLSEFDQELGWASGFGVLANYTHQDFSGGDTVNTATSRAQAIFNALGATDTVTFQQPLIDLSEDAYNVTGYYEKFGLSARARYTWRSAYRSTDFGSTSSFPYGFPVVQAARGQLNASVIYDVSDNFNVGIEGVNLTESPVEQYAVNEGGPLAFQGLTDRRVTIGANYRF